MNPRMKRMQPPVVSAPMPYSWREITRAAACSQSRNGESACISKGQESRDFTEVGALGSGGLGDGSVVVNVFEFRFRSLDAPVRYRALTPRHFESLHQRSEFHFTSRR